MPKFRVHSKLGNKQAFRRNGVAFGAEPQTIDTEKVAMPDGTVRAWTPAELDDFLSAETATALHIEHDGKVLRHDGPTLEEFMAKGYKAADYPPAGYGVRQSPDLRSYRAARAAQAVAAKRPAWEGEVSTGKTPDLMAPEPGTPEEALVAAAVAGEEPGADNTMRAETTPTAERPHRRGR